MRKNIKKVIFIILNKHKLTFKNHYIILNKNHFLNKKSFFFGTKKNPFFNLKQTSPKYNFTKPISAYDNSYSHQTHVTPATNPRTNTVVIEFNIPQAQKYCIYNLSTRVLTLEVSFDYFRTNDKEILL